MTVLSTTMLQDNIHQAGLEALHRELGPVGMVRFTHQFNKGSGDYTAERAQLQAGVTVDDVMAAIEKRRAEGQPAPKPRPRHAEVPAISPNASPDEIRGAGLSALRRELGSTALVLFLRDFIKLPGDLAAVRAKLAGHLSDEEISEVVARMSDGGA